MGAKKKPLQSDKKKRYVCVFYFSVLDITKEDVAHASFLCHRIKEGIYIHLRWIAEQRTSTFIHLQCFSVGKFSFRNDLT